MTGTASIVMACTAVADDNGMRELHDVAAASLCRVRMTSPTAIRFSRAPVTRAAFTGNGALVDPPVEGFSHFGGIAK